MEINLDVKLLVKVVCIQCERESTGFSISEFIQYSRAVYDSPQNIKTEPQNMTADQHTGND